MRGEVLRAPFPWFGGKSRAAPQVWAALGDVDHYVEPFAGSLAVLLRRPHVANRTYHSETVNDLDGLLCNAWRAIVHAPDAVAEAASWPVCEADFTAGSGTTGVAALLEGRRAILVERDPVHAETCRGRCEETEPGVGSRPAKQLVLGGVR